MKRLFVFALIVGVGILAGMAAPTQAAHESASGTKRTAAECNRLADAKARQACIDHARQEEAVAAIDANNASTAPADACRKSGGVTVGVSVSKGGNCIGGN